MSNESSNIGVDVTWAYRSTCTLKQHYTITIIIISKGQDDENLIKRVDELSMSSHALFCENFFWCLMNRHMYLTKYKVLQLSNTWLSAGIT